MQLVQRISYTYTTVISRVMGAGMGQYVKDCHLPIHSIRADQNNEKRTFRLFTDRHTSPHVIMIENILDVTNTKIGG